MKTYYELKITETARNCPNAESSQFNIIREQFGTKEQIKGFLTERYGKIPNGKNKIYIDDLRESKIIGFLYSFWNKDWSHASKSWFQTDWVECYIMTKEHCLI